MTATTHRPTAEPGQSTSCSNDAARALIASGATLEDSILSVRGERVILDSVLAVLYGVAEPPAPA